MENLNLLETKSRGNDTFLNSLHITFVYQTQTWNRHVRWYRQWIALRAKRTELATVWLMRILLQVRVSYNQYMWKLCKWLRTKLCWFASTLWSFKVAKSVFRDVWLKGNRNKFLKHPVLQRCHSDAETEREFRDEDVATWICNRGRTKDPFPCWYFALFRASSPTIAWWKTPQRCWRIQVIAGCPA